MIERLFARICVYLIGRTVLMLNNHQHTQMEIRHWDEEDEPEFVLVEDSKAGSNINCTAETVLFCCCGNTQHFVARVSFRVGPVSHTHTHPPSPQPTPPTAAGDPRGQAVRDRAAHRHARGGGGREVHRAGARLRHAAARHAAHGKF